MMKTVPEVMDALGTLTNTAENLGLPITTVASWKARHSIPVEHWRALVGYAQKSGVPGLNYETLVAIHSPVRRKIA